MKGRNVVVIGAQWGDEGKGKYVDLLAKDAAYVVRFQGGDNAGHTLVYKDKDGIEQKTVLHTVPSGILISGVKCLVGNGTVVSPISLVKEIEGLVQKGIQVSGRLLIDGRAALILPSHIALDVASEKAKGADAIGTTKSGIGPAYEDKVARRTLHFADLFKPNFETELGKLIAYHNKLLVHVYNEPAIEFTAVRDQLRALIPQLKPFLHQDIASLIVKAKSEGKNVLFEGAQGTGLDIDHGTYPYVTSSSTVAAAASTGTGVGFKELNYVLAVIKAYTTRVGAGPFVVELNNDIGEGIRQRGKEFGSKTGRPRRCGWLDMVALRSAITLDSIDGFAVTKIDILDGVDEICICTGYKTDTGRTSDFPPKDTDELAEYKPVYEKFPGWKESTYGKTSIADLPANARKFLLRIEELTKKPIDMISTGPDRAHSINLYNPLIDTRKIVGPTPLQMACKKADVADFSKAKTQPVMVSQPVKTAPAVVAETVSAVPPVASVETTSPAETPVQRSRSIKDSKIFAMWEQNTKKEAEEATLTRGMSKKQ